MRSHQWRQKPTKEFICLLGIARNIRMYLIQEQGPTKFILEDGRKKKFKIQIGENINCSCGGGKREHCVHTIYLLLKIFGIQPGDPMLWQLGFIDSEINKLLALRSGHQFVSLPRPSLDSNLLPPGGMKSASKPKVPRMDLDDDHMCAICHEDMTIDENITYCETGCGHNLHVDCMKRWVKHKISENKKITCPLCRNQWEGDVLDHLKKQTIEFYRRQEHALKKAARNPQNVKLKYTTLTEKTFRCEVCKRSLYTSFEDRLHCLYCLDYDICSICHKSGSHDYHPFIIKPKGKFLWQPAFYSKMQDEEGMCSHVYKDLMNREITEEDYDLLLKLDEKVDMKLEVYLFKVCKMQMNAGLVSVPPSSGICVHCDHPLPNDVNERLVLPCGDTLHLNCAEDLLTLERYWCPRHSQTTFLPGLNSIIKEKAVSEIKKENNINGKQFHQKVIKEQEKKAGRELGVMGSQLLVTGGNVGTGTLLKSSKFQRPPRGQNPNPLEEIKEEIMGDSEQRLPFPDMSGLIMGGVSGIPVRTETVFRRLPPRDVKVRQIARGDMRGVPQLRAPMKENLGEQVVLSQEMLSIAGITIDAEGRVSLRDRKHGGNVGDQNYALAHNPRQQTLMQRGGYAHGGCGPHRQQHAHTHSTRPACPPELELEVGGLGGLLNESGEFNPSVLVHPLQDNIDLLSILKVAPQGKRPASHRRHSHRGNNSNNNKQAIRIPDIRGHQLLSPPYSQGGLSRDEARLRQGHKELLRKKERDKIITKIRSSGGGVAEFYTQRGAQNLQVAGNKLLGGKGGRISKNGSKTPLHDIHSQNINLDDSYTTNLNTN